MRLIDQKQIADLAEPIVETVWGLLNVEDPSFDGRTVIAKPFVRNPRFNFDQYVLREIATGKIHITRGRSVLQQYGRRSEYPESEFELISVCQCYRGKRPSRDFGLYVLPHGVKAGDRVYIRELIEDVVATEFWGPVLADDGFGTFDGEAIQIDMNPYRGLKLMG